MKKNNNLKLAVFISLVAVLLTCVNFYVNKKYLQGYNNIKYDYKKIGNENDTCQINNLADYTSADSRVRSLEILNNLEIENTAGFHNSIFRGKDITSYKTDGSIWNRINGTGGYDLFEDLYVGDYFETSYTPPSGYGSTMTVRWRIAGFDTYMYYGDNGDSTAVWRTKHHVAIVPDRPLGNDHVMNSTNITTGGYWESEMRTYLDNSILPTIRNVFGTDHVLKYRALVSTAVDNNRFNRWGTYSTATVSGTTVVTKGGGASSNWVWQTRYLDLMSEVQVTGSIEWSSSGYDIGTANKQFPLFKLGQDYIVAHDTSNNKYTYWLSGVTSSSNFAVVGYLGNSYGATGASNSRSVRPYFYIG